MGSRPAVLALAEAGHSRRPRRPFRPERRPVPPCTLPVPGMAVSLRGSTLLWCPRRHSCWARHPRCLSVALRASPTGCGTAGSLRCRRTPRAAARDHGGGATRWRGQRRIHGDTCRTAPDTPPGTCRKQRGRSRPAALPACRRSSWRTNRTTGEPPAPDGGRFAPFAHFESTAAASGRGAYASGWRNHCRSGPHPFLRRPSPPRRQFVRRHPFLRMLPGA